MATLTIREMPLQALQMQQPQLRQPLKQKRRAKLSGAQMKILAVNLIAIVISVAVIFWCIMSATNVVVPLDQRENVLQEYLRCTHKTLEYTPQQRDNYWLLSNYFIGAATERAGCASHVTYVVHGSVEGNFFQNLPELIRSWQAPISAGLYAPGDHFNATLDAIQYARNCIPEAELVRRFVSFHLFFPAHVEQMPASMPHTAEEAANWEYDCQRQKQMQMPQTEVMRRRSPRESYPVNVALNMARRAVNTHFVLLSPDAAYVPHDVIEGQSISEGFMQAQLEEFCPLNQKSLLNVCKTKEEIQELDGRRRLYILPLYELDPAVNTPKSPLELEHAVAQGSAVLKLSTKKPVFISNNLVPWFDERLPLEKEAWHDFVQPYAMCLLEYQMNLFAKGFLFRKIVNKNIKTLALENKSGAKGEHLKAATLKAEYLALFGNTHEEQCRFNGIF